MTLRGHMKNGVAVLDEPANLPDGTPVRIEVERIDADFWRGKSVEELVREQGVILLGMNTVGFPRTVTAWSWAHEQFRRGM